MGLRAVASVVSVTAALVGCASEPQAPSTLPSLTAAPSPTPSATPTPSAISAGTPEGAAEFARYWYQQVELAYAKKDPEILEGLSAPTCKACQAFRESVAQLQREGGRVEGLRFELRAAETRPFTGDTAVVDVVYDAPETVSYDANGAVDLREPAIKFAEESVRLVRSTTGSWLVADITPA
jgi:predicted lipid-binding transport protein (Tim44 family)